LTTKISAHELEDNAAEVVETHPARRRPPRDDTSKVAKADPGGRMEKMRAAGTRHRQDFILVRTPRGVAKISFPHFDTYKAIWRIWLSKRTNAEPNPGVTITDLMEMTGQRQNTLQNIVTSLRKNGIIRSVVQHVGWRGTRAFYFPTTVGDELLKMAEYLGPGSMVQVGRNSTAWRARNQDQPQDIFKFAALLKNGS